MKKISLKNFTYFLSLLFLVFFTVQAQAICPICTIAVGAGIGLAQWLGIDDSITGLWIGGLTVSLIAWTINWLNKKNIRFFGRKPLIVLGYYALIVLPLYFKGLIGHPLNTLWGYDKLVVGIILGSILFTIGAATYEILKRKNQGHAYFPFQKVVMPVGPLLIFSVVFYFLTK